MSRLMAMSPEPMTAMTPEAVQLCFARIVATVMIATSAATKPTVGSLTGPPAISPCSCRWRWEMST